MLKMKNVFKMEKIKYNIRYICIICNALLQAQHIYSDQFIIVKLYYSFNFFSFCVITIIVLFSETTEQV